MSRKIEDALLIKGKAKIQEKDPETGEVISEEEYENVVVDVAGASKIADYIAGNSPASDFAYMVIGSGDASAPTETDTTLETRGDTSPSLSATVTNTKSVQWSHTFSSGTGKTSIVELGLFDGSGTADGMLNRLTFASKDNANNDLAITYTLTVS